MDRKRHTFIFSLLFFLMFWPCNALAIEMVVSAASSLKLVLEELINRETKYGKKNQKISTPFSVLLNFASSHSFIKQIANGAPIDLVISAAEEPLEELKKKKLLMPGTQGNLLTNKLVLIAGKADQNLSINQMNDLLSSQVKRIVIGDPDRVPVGFYAKKALETLKLWESLKEKLLFAQSARHVLKILETGAADAAIVFHTDACSSPQWKILSGFNQNTYPPIIYSFAIPVTSRHPEAAKAFVSWLQEKEQLTLFQEYGFGIISSKKKFEDLLEYN